MKGDQKVNSKSFSLFIIEQKLHNLTNLQNENWSGKMLTSKTKSKFGVLLKLGKN